MRANRKLQRIFCSVPLATGAGFAIEPQQAHYLLNVLRLREGDEILVFNGVDGEWRATIAPQGRRQVRLVVGETERAQAAAPDLVFCFAPIKAGRLDYLVQKAVELGAGVIQPVITSRTQLSNPGAKRMTANIIEASEQCGVLSVPEYREPLGLERLLSNWPPERRLVFCDEAATAKNPLEPLAALGRGPLGLIVGPEGGFATEEREMLLGLPFVTAISLGSRILRADTAAVAVLSVVQAAIGDW